METLKTTSVNRKVLFKIGVSPSANRDHLARRIEKLGGETFTMPMDHNVFYAIPKHPSSDQFIENYVLRLMRMYQNLITKFETILQHDPTHPHPANHIKGGHRIRHHRK
jgi:hypothetical protein